jgi:hypothetical protein
MERQRIEAGLLEAWIEKRKKIALEVNNLAFKAKAGADDEGDSEEDDKGNDARARGEVCPGCRELYPKSGKGGIAAHKKKCKLFLKMKHQQSEVSDTDVENVKPNVGFKDDIFNKKERSPIVKTSLKPSAWGIADSDDDISFVEESKAVRPREASSDEFEMTPKGYAPPATKKAVLKRVQQQLRGIGMNVHDLLDDEDDSSRFETITDDHDVNVKIEENPLGMDPHEIYFATQLAEHQEQLQVSVKPQQQLRVSHISKGQADDSDLSDLDETTMASMILLLRKPTDKGPEESDA